MQIDFFNPRSIICLIAILQGLVFAGLLAVRFVRRRENADLWLLILLLTFCSSLVTPLIGFANVYDNNQWLTYFPFSINYSAGVLVWLYTVSLTDSRRSFRAADLLFFVPTAVYLAYRLFLFSHDLAWKDWFGDTYGEMAGGVIFVTELIWNVAFLAFSIAHYRKYRVWLNENFSDTEKLKFDWLRNFLYIFTAILVLGAAFDFFNSFIAKLSYIQYFYFELVLALVTYGLAVAGYLRSKTIELSFDADAEERSEERKSPVNEREVSRLKERLAVMMEDEKLYLEPNITLSDLARRIGVNTSVLSFTINNGFGKNFNDFINEYRIEDVKNRLSGDDEATLLSVAFECGFNSKATFNRAFKKFTGVSPKEFQMSSDKNIYV